MSIRQQFDGKIQFSCMIRECQLVYDAYRAPGKKYKYLL